MYRRYAHSEDEKGSEHQLINLSHTETVHLDNEMIQIVATLTSEIHQKANEGYGEIRNKAAAITEYLKAKNVPNLKTKRFTLPQYYSSKTVTGILSTSTTSVKKLSGYKARFGVYFEMSLEENVSEVLDWLTDQSMEIGRQVYFVTDKTMEETEMKLLYIATKKATRKAKLVAAALTGNQNATLVTKHIDVRKSSGYSGRQEMLNVAIQSGFDSSSRRRRATPSAAGGQSELTVSVDCRFGYE